MITTSITGKVKYNEELYSVIFHEMLFSRLHFSGDLMSWTDDLPEVNEMLRYILFTSRFNHIFPRVKHWLCDYTRHVILVNLWLFHVKTRSKMKEWSCSLHAPCWTEAFTQRSVTPHQRAPKRHLLSELKFPEKLNDFFGTRAYRTEIPVPKIFGMNTCTVTPLLHSSKPQYLLVCFFYMKKQQEFPWANHWIMDLNRFIKVIRMLTVYDLSQS